MKSVFVLLTLILLSTTVYSSEKYSLEWKLKPKETVVYYFSQENGSFDSTFKKIVSKINQDVDSTNKGAAVFNNLKEIFSEMSSNKNPMISFVVGKTSETFNLYSYMNLLNKQETVDSSIFANWFKRPMLDAELNKNGRLNNFYLPPSTKNLVNMFYTLPNKPIEINDSWMIDVNFLSMNQAFSCDSMYQNNKATLVDVVEENGEKIALISYSIDEYLSGKIHMPFGKGDKEPENGFVSAKMKAIAKFSISNGRMIHYRGKLNLNAENMMFQDMSQTFGLEIAEDFPPEILKLLENK